MMEMAIVNQQMLLPNQIFQRLCYLISFLVSSCALLTVQEFIQENLKADQRFIGVVTAGNHAYVIDHLIDDSRLMMCDPAEGVMRDYSISKLNKAGAKVMYRVCAEGHSYRSELEESDGDSEDEDWSSISSVSSVSASAFNASSSDSD